MNSTCSFHSGPLARGIYTLILVAALWNLPVRVHAQAPQYNVTVLSGLGGSEGSYDSGVNASGEVVGDSYTSGNVAQDAVVWNGATPTALTGGTSPDIYGVNASGQVVGSYYNQAEVWNGTTTVLTGLGGGSSGASAINDSGVVVGYSNTPGNAAQDAVVWNGATPTALTGEGGTQSAALAINASGQVAGYSYSSNSNLIYAVLWNGTTPTILGNIVGSDKCYAVAINASGQVAGYSYNDTTNADTAVVWNGTTPTALGSLGGSFGSEAVAMNDSGQIVGYSWNSGDAGVDGFLYTGGTMYDLNSIVVPGSGVTNIRVEGPGDAINDSGQIAAYGTYEGQQVALLLTPTPEPGSAALLAPGAAALLGRRRHGFD